MAMIRTSRILLVIMLLLGLCQEARSDLIVSDNLSQTSAGWQVLQGSTNWYAQQFVWDVSAGYAGPIAVTLKMDMSPDIDDLSKTPKIFIYDDVGQKPGSAELALWPSGTTNADQTLGVGTFNTFTKSTLSSSGVKLLTPGETYWVVIQGGASGNTDISWYYTDSTSGTGSGFSSLSATSLDNQVNWSTSNTQPYQMRISAVPEPSSAMLASLGVCVMVASRRGMSRQRGWKRS